MVNADPHFCASLFKFTPGQLTLTEGRKEALGVGPGGGGGLGGHRAQLTPLAEPAEGDDIRMKMRRADSHADDIWKTEFSDVAHAHNQKRSFFSVLNRGESSYQSHFGSLPAEFQTPLEELKGKIYKVWLT